MMRKRVYRFFYGFIEAQERFLNRQAADGWRLIDCGRLHYDFERCQPGEYHYCMDFIAEKSLSEARKYREFLEDLGYRVLQKPLNVNYSIGKVRWRPWAKGGGQIATNPGSFNKELLIVEQPGDASDCPLHTTLEDRIAYYGRMRWMWLWVSLLCAFGVAINWFKLGLTWRSYVFAGLMLVHAVVFWANQRRYRALKAEAEVIE